MMEESDSNHISDMALRCCSVFFDRRPKSLLVEDLLPTACAEVLGYLVPNTSADYRSVPRYAQVPGDISHSNRRQLASPSICDDLVLKLRLIEPMPRDLVLSVNTTVDGFSVGAHIGGADVLLMVTRSNFITKMDTSSSTSYRPSSVYLHAS